MAKSDDDRSYWFDAAPLTEGRSGVTARLRRQGGGGLEAFAHANDLDYDASVAGDLPSLLIHTRSVCKDVVATRGEPKVEFGNHGARFSLGSDDLVPSRQGYIAVRHGRSLPHVLVDYNGVLGAMTPLNVTSAALTFLSEFDEDKHDADQSPLAHFRRTGVRLELPTAPGVAAHTATGSERQASELLSGETLSVMADLSRSFSVEMREGWVFAYSHFGDVTTKDPDVWAWVFATASRLLDLSRLWLDAWPAAAGEYVAAGTDPRAVPFYTDQRIDRPAKLDGALRFLKRSR